MSNGGREPGDPGSHRDGPPEYGTPDYGFPEAEPGTDLVPVDPPESWGPLTRDFLVFEGKLLLDGFIDIVMTSVAAVAFVLDLLSGDRSGRRFYALLRMGRRLEHWVRLYRPSSRAGAPKERLTDAGRAGADHLLQKIEGMVREQELPEAYRERLRALAEKARGRGGGPDADTESREGSPDGRSTP